MFNLGMGEITVILLLALIVLGPKKLPELASGLGKIIRDIRKATSDVKNELQLDEAIRKPFEELRDAVTLPPEELKRRDRIKRDLEEAKRKAEADLAILAASTKAAAESSADAKPADGAIPATVTTSQSGGVPLPPPLAAVGSGPVPVPPPFPAPGSGPNGHAAVPPPFHPPHAVGSGPLAATAAAPPGTIPATPRAPRPAFRSPVVATTVVPPPKAVPERSSVTQFLSEADLIPPNGPPPMPPPVPGSTGKMPSVPGTTGKTAAAPVASADDPSSIGAQKDDKKDDAG